MTDQQLPYTIVVPTVYGQMMINRFDINQSNALIKTGASPEHGEIQLLCRILDLLPAAGRRVFVDVGANVGTHTLAVARHLGSKGQVYGFEPQRLLFQLVCGSAALNSMTNVHLHNVAVGAGPGQIEVPQFDYFRPMNFGSVEFGPEQKEALHQGRARDPRQIEYVPRVALDSFNWPMVHLLKIDAEGMEFEVLAGAEKTISRCSPVIMIEHLKVDAAVLRDKLVGLGYAVVDVASNYLCIPGKYAGVIALDGSERG